MEESSDQTLAISGADSVYAYVRQLAETVPEGMRWQTLDFHNEPQYHVSVFNGVAGIGLFLADYARIRDAGEARALALGANRWCMAHSHETDNESLYRGRSGIGISWLKYFALTQDGEALINAKKIGDGILSLDPGPVTDVFKGSAGEALFLIRLWHASQDEKYLQGAIRNAIWLNSVVKRDNMGCYWPMNIEREPHPPMPGFAHGISGHAYFFLALFEATGDQRWANLVCDVAETLNRLAIQNHVGLNWPYVAGHTENIPCQWCNGAPGVGVFWVKAFEVLNDKAYLEKAIACGETTFNYGDVRNNPSQCHGLSGNAELFIELFRATKNQIWLDRAFVFAKQAMAYCETTPEGIRWQADDPGFYSPDFMCGASGVGHFFLRLLQPNTLMMPLS